VPTEAEQLRLLSLLSPGAAADIIEDISDSKAADRVEEIPLGQTASIMEELHSHHLADVLSELEDCRATNNTFAPLTNMFSLPNVMVRRITSTIS
jgi:Mg/Co/Ni transporter MgtE